MAGHLANYLLVFFSQLMCGGMRNKEWLGSFCIESTLSCMCAEGLLFASIDRKVILLAGDMLSQISARLMS